MRRLFIAIVVLAGLYSAYWVIGSRTVENQAVATIDGLRADGWDISYDSLRTRGFPSRFDTTVTGLSATDPEGAIALSAPFFQVFALSYRPNRVIAAFPPSQTLTIGDVTLSLTVDQMLASAAVAANTDLSFETATLSGETLLVQSDAFGQARLSGLIAAARATDTDRTYDLFADFDTLRLPDDMRAQLDPEGALPETINRVTLNATVGLDRVLDRHIGNTPLYLQQITLGETMLNWGDLTVDLTGALDINAVGLPEGQIIVGVRNWRLLPPLLVSAGVIEPGVATTLTGMFETLSQGDDRLDLPLDFAGGQIRFGPLPLGPAPRLGG